MKKLGFGLMRLPIIEDNYANVDLGTFKKMVDAFLQRGFTYFDTAYMYHDGQSENFFRLAVAQRYPRTAYTVATKMPIMMIDKKEDLPRIFNEQLQKCGVEYFDYYLLHAINQARYDDAVVKLDCFGFISQMKKEGKIKQIGFSFHDTASVLDSVLTAHPEVDFVQLQINYMDWVSLTVQAEQCYKICEKHNVKVVVMEPVKGGKLASISANAQEVFKSINPSATPASFAVRFAASLPNVFMVLSGMSTMEQLLDNTQYMSDFVPLNKAEQEAVCTVRDIISKSIIVPCTSCRYCIEGCPSKIPINRYFTLLNETAQYSADGLDKAKSTYRQMTEQLAPASACVECNACVSACPQKINVPQMLKKVTETLE